MAEDCTILSWSLLDSVTLAFARFPSPWSCRSSFTSSCLPWYIAWLYSATLSLLTGSSEIVSWSLSFRILAAHIGYFSTPSTRNLRSLNEIQACERGHNINLISGWSTEVCITFTSEANSTSSLTHLSITGSNIAEAPNQRTQQSIQFRRTANWE